MRKIVDKDPSCIEGALGDLMSTVVESEPGSVEGKDLLLTEKKWCWGWYYSWENMNRVV